VNPLRDSPKAVRTSNVMNSIIKRQPETPSDLDAFIWAMFLLWRSRPGSAEPDETGAYFIGDVGEARLSDQRLRRETPYSICKGIREE
jgi:hypothetical protein